MKRILIDGRFIGVGESISRYTLEILSGILKLDKKNQYTILLRPQGKKELTHTELFHRKGTEIKSKYHNLKVEILDIPHYSVPEQTRLLRYLNQEKYDLVHFTQFNHPIRYRGNYVITIHDLTLLGHLHRMNPLKRLGFKGVMKSAVKDSRKIITISDVSKKDIIETYKVDPEKISVTHLGVDKKFNTRIKNQESRIREFKKKYKIGGEYILYTGMWKKHKNLIRLLKAFEVFVKNGYNRHQPETPKCNDDGRGKSFSQINTNLQISNPKKLSPLPAGPRQNAGQLTTYNLQLVFVGKIDHDEPEVLAEISRINKLPATSYQLPVIVTTGFIDEDELPVSYAGAIAYVIPSLSEGFGLPPLEAMASGTPVLSSNISAMPEILGSAALYFDPYSVSDIATKIEKIVTDKKLREVLSKKGLEHVKKYDWQETAESTLKVYKEALK